MRTTSPSLVVATLLVIAFVAVHAAMLWQFTDESLFLTPDFVDYLVGARSLASGQGYRDLSNPDRPILTRPVGVPILLAAVVGADGPFPLMECKRLFNLLSIAICLVGGWSAGRAFGTSTGLLIAGLLAVNPVPIIMGTNLYSEVPYCLSLLALFALLAGVDPKSSKLGDCLRFGIAAALAVLAEKSRTMGLVLWPGLLLATIFGKRNWPAAAVVACAFFGSMAVDRLPMLGKPAAAHYLSFFREVHGNQGIGAVFGSAVVAATSYLECASAVICPILWPGLDWFGVRTRYLAPEWISVALGIVVVATTAVQMSRWLRSGRAALALVALVHFMGIAAALLIWPRMARLAYPLYVQCVVIFWGAAFEFCGRRSARLLRSIQWTAAASFALSCLPLARDGVIPSGMWPQIKSAGQALANDPEPNQRIATDAKDLYLATRRPQRFVNASSQVMDDLNRLLLESRVNRYGFVGRASDPKLGNNPVYLFKPITLNAYGYSMLALEPNRRGSAVDAQRQWKPALARLPTTPPTNVPKLLLHEVVQQTLVAHDHDGDTAAAASRLQAALADARHSTPGATEAWLVLGLLQIELLRPDEARASFTQASRCDYADVYAATIAGGRASAKVIEPLASGAPPTTAAHSMAIREQIAASLLASGRFRQALQVADRILAEESRRLPAAALRLYALRRIDGPAQSAASLQWATGLLSNRSDEELRLFRQPFEDIRFQIANSRLLELLLADRAGSFALEGKPIVVDNNRPEVYLELSQAMERENLPGVALDLFARVAEMEGAAKAAVRADPQFWWTLAVLEDVFGRPVEAARHAAQAEALELLKK